MINPDPRAALADELCEYRKMRYMGDCKCGDCQLVPLTLIDRIISALVSPSPYSAALADELEAMRALVRGYEVLARDSLGAGLRAEYALVAKALTLASARSPSPYSGAELPVRERLLSIAEAIDEQISDIHAAFGAPGDYGYESREGKALYALYKSQVELRAAILETNTVEG